MTDAASGSQRPDYGLDAPGVVRNLFLVAAIGLCLWASVALKVWSGVVRLNLGAVRLLFPLGMIGLFCALSFTATGLWMVWSSKVGKVREREKLLDRISWSGNERVLDVGCGRGLMMIGAAKRLTSGKASGIDIWQAQENARREGVADRIEVKTADMREIPFPDASFDVVVSCAAIHNLYSAPDRAKAIAEIARVLKPGAIALIDDIRHHGEYAATFAKAGCSARRIGSPVGRLLAAAITMGSLRPDILFVRKSA